MKKGKWTITAVTMVFGFMSMSASAQFTGKGAPTQIQDQATLSSIQSGGYSGPSSMPQYNSVAAIKKDPIDNVRVILSGYLTEQIAHERYYFSDGKDAIIVEIDDEDMPPFMMNETTHISIIGEIEAGLLERTHIEVDRIQLVQ